ncbi:unnamed protein product [Urochloa humidicola]
MAEELSMMPLLSSSLFPPRFWMQELQCRRQTHSIWSTHSGNNDVGRLQAPLPGNLFATGICSSSIPGFILYTPDCDETMKPKIGMTFTDVDSTKEFCKCYAHVGFSVHIRQHKVVDEVVLHKRFYFAKEVPIGFVLTGGRTEKRLA